MHPSGYPFIFNVGSVHTKTFVIMLANHNPKSFISGASIGLGAALKTVNRNEFHHIFPKKHLERSGIDGYKINCLANFCFLNNADNQKIKDKEPSVYKALLPAQSLEDILTSSLCPDNSLDLTFDEFTAKRAEMLKEAAINLIN